MIVKLWFCGRSRERYEVNVDGCMGTRQRDSLFSSESATQDED